MENTKFWSGFEKQAKKKKKAFWSTEPQDTNNYDKALLASSLTGLASQGFMHAGSLLDENINPDKTMSLVSDLSKHFNITAPSLNEVMLDSDSFYAPNEHVLGIADRPLQGTVAHEMGHASVKSPTKGLLSKIRKTNSKLDLLTRNDIGRHIPKLPGLALLSQDEDIRRWAAPASLALSLPTLIEEGVASTTGLHAINKLRGTKAAIRAAPGLLGAFGTYAAIPIGVYLANKWIGHLKKAGYHPRDHMIAASALKATYETTPLLGKLSPHYRQAKKYMTTKDPVEAHKIRHDYLTDMDKNG